MFRRDNRGPTTGPENPPTRKHTTNRYTQRINLPGSEYLVLNNQVFSFHKNIRFGFVIALGLRKMWSS